MDWLINFFTVIMSQRAWTARRILCYKKCPQLQNHKSPTNTKKYCWCYFHWKRIILLSTKEGIKSKPCCRCHNMLNAYNSRGRKELCWRAPVMILLPEEQLKLSKHSKSAHFYISDSEKSCSVFLLKMSDKIYTPKLCAFFFLLFPYPDVY